LSLAWACARHIATRIRAFTLFATHYFELTALAQETEGCANVHLDATEHGDQLVFLHAVKEGPANRSYGLQVAALAGVPRNVISHARRYLQELEHARDHRVAADAQAQLPLTVTEPDLRLEAMRRQIESIDPDHLAPREALDLLYRLRKLLDE
jgi:DNA mismatch repair protein MutS